MVTCFLDYRIDPSKLDALEEYGRAWMFLVEDFGGTHHGYFLPHEGASDRAIAIFSFPSLAAYEKYRSLAATDPRGQEAYALAEATECILRYDRSFLRPLQR